jgi:hypothetical protein
VGALVWRAVILASRRIHTHRVLAARDLGLAAVRQVDEMTARNHARPAAGLTRLSGATHARGV